MRRKCQREHVVDHTLDHTPINALEWFGTAFEESDTLTKERFVTRQQLKVQSWESDEDLVSYGSMIYYRRSNHKSLYIQLVFSGN